MTVEEFEDQIRDRYECIDVGIDNNDMLRILVVPALLQILKNQEIILKELQILRNRNNC